MRFLLLLFFIAPCESPGESRLPVKAMHGMVVSAESLATAAGAEILKKGGNAIDAAVAVGFTLAVTYPEAGNIGGGGFMLIRLANGRSTMIDFREKAPAAATRNMFLDSTGNQIPGKSLEGPLAAGVPGTPAGFIHALKRYGTMKRKAVMKKAIGLAERGFPVDDRLATSLHDARDGFNPFPSTKKIFLKDGVTHHAGALLRQPDLARTLKAIRDYGIGGFYHGRVAGLIVKEMKRGGGIIAKKDLADYRVVERVPLRSSYRGYEIISSAPPSAGGIVLLEMLNVLERFDLRGKGAHSSQVVHWFASAAQRAYADRATYLGDPDFVAIPVSGLISKTYGAARCATIDSVRATSSSEIAAGVVDTVDRHETTHYCTADQYGNVVSVTFTLNDYYGCKTVVDGAGFFLNNEMDDFVVKPGSPNSFGLTGGEANAIAPGKRMLSSMTPTILVKDGKPFMAVGARGGGRITTAVAQVIINVIDFDMTIAEAVEAPRVHHQWLPDRLLVEPRGLSTEVIENLQRRGYVVESLPSANLGRVQALLIGHASGFIFGGPDPREQGVAKGY